MVKANLNVYFLSFVVRPFNNTSRFANVISFLKTNFNSVKGGIDHFVSLWNLNHTLCYFDSITVGVGRASED